MALRNSRAVGAGLLNDSVDSNTCRGSFSDGTVISQFVVYAACFLALLSTAICWLRISKKRPRIRAILSWHNYCLALLLTMIFYLLEILVIPLASCSAMNGKGSGITLITSEITLQLSGFILLVVILLPFTLSLLRQAGQNTRFVKIANTCILSLVGLLLPPYLVVGSLFGLSPWTHQTAHLDLRVILGFSAAYTALYLFASVFGAAFLVFALLKAVGDVALSSAAKLWTLFTLSNFVLSNLVWVIDVFGWVLPQRNLPKAGFAAMIVLGHACLAATFAGMLMAISNCDLPPHDAMDDARYNPDDVRYNPDDVDVQLDVKRGFDSDGTAEIDQSSPRYSRYSAAEDSKILRQPQISQTLVSDYRGV